MAGTISTSYGSGLFPSKAQSQGVLERLRESTRQAQKDSEKLASGKKINHAGDNPAGLAIAEKLLSQVSGYDTASNNILDMGNAMNTADGAMSSIQDSIGRMQELATQAANGTYSSEDRAIIQDEMNQIKDSISQTASSTQFNGNNLLDGSFQNRSTGSTPNGGGMNASIGNAGLGSLGISSIDVSGNYSTNSIASTLSALSGASAQVSKQRGSIGAQSNALEYAYNVNQQASINQTESLSRIADTDMAKSAMDFQKDSLLQQVGMFALQQKMNGASLSAMFG